MRTDGLSRRKTAVHPDGSVAPVHAGRKTVAGKQLRPPGDAKHGPVLEASTATSSFVELSPRLVEVARCPRSSANWAAREAANGCGQRDRHHSEPARASKLRVGFGLRESPAEMSTYQHLNGPRNRKAKRSGSLRMVLDCGCGRRPK
jgi:hypothetical protein